MILFLNHFQPRCGVYQMGRRIGLALHDSGKVVYQENHNTIATGIMAFQHFQPQAVVYNWHPITMPWAPDLARRFPSAKHIAIMHDITPRTTSAGSELFQHRIACYPGLPVDNTSLFRSVRHVPRYEKSRPDNDRLTVGSFGFAVGGKMYPLIVRLVSESLPGALVRLRIPHAHYGDDEGEMARSLAQQCYQHASNGVDFEVSHDFLEEDGLIDWLAGNDLNVFFYDGHPGRGLASTVDYAIAARRPIAVNDNADALRHVHDRLSYWPKMNLRELYECTGPVVESLYNEWTPDRMVREYVEMFQTLGVS